MKKLPVRLSKRYRVYATLRDGTHYAYGSYDQYPKEYIHLRALRVFRDAVQAATYDSEWRRYHLSDAEWRAAVDNASVRGHRPH